LILSSTEKGLEIVDALDDLEECSFVIRGIIVAVRSTVFIQILVLISTTALVVVAKGDVFPIVLLTLV